MIQTCNDGGRPNTAKSHWRRTGLTLATIGLLAPLMGCQGERVTGKIAKSAQLRSAATLPTLTRVKSAAADPVMQHIDLPPLYVVGRVPHRRPPNRAWLDVGTIEGLPVLAPPLPRPVPAPPLDAELDQTAAATPSAQLALGEAPQPQLPAEPTLGDPGLPPSEVADVFASERDAVRVCYQSALLLDHSLRGRLMVKVVVGHDGRPERVKVSSRELQGTPVIPCVARTFKSARFAPPAGDFVSISYPYVLAPGSV